MECLSETSELCGPCSFLISSDESSAAAFFCVLMEYEKQNKVSALKWCRWLLQTTDLLFYHQHNTRKNLNMTAAFMRGCARACGRAAALWLAFLHAPQSLRLLMEWESDPAREPGPRSDLLCGNAWFCRVHLPGLGAANVNQKLANVVAVFRIHMIPLQNHLRMTRII